MYTLYKSDDLRDILLQIVKKTREHNYKINIICKNEEIVTTISNFLWNHCIPNWIVNDLYESQNHIFVSVDIKYVDVLIIYDDAFFEENEDYANHNFVKKIIIGTSHNVKGEYWGKQKTGWKKLTHNTFFS